MLISQVRYAQKITQENFLEILTYYALNFLILLRLYVYTNNYQKSWSISVDNSNKATFVIRVLTSEL